MRRALLSLLVLFGFAAPVDAAKPVASGTIVLNETGPFTFGDTVSFSTTTANLKGSDNPRIEVLCSSVVDGSLLYGEAGGLDNVFLLGGGWSRWWEQRDDVSCVANLFVFGKTNGSQTYTVLASTSFTATG
jgi:hypothetical protein